MVVVWWLTNSSRRESQLVPCQVASHAVKVNVFRTMNFLLSCPRVVQTAHRFGVGDVIALLELMHSGLIVEFIILVRAFGIVEFFQPNRGL